MYDYIRSPVNDLIIIYKKLGKDECPQYLLV
jgi:hypothetical protein